MTKKAALLILSLVVFAFSLCAFPPHEAQIEVASNTTSRPADDSAQTADGPALQRLSLSHRNPRYQLGKGDVLDLDFPFTPEFNQTLTILPDGYISLRGVGSLHVEGETVPELKASLQRVYAKILRQPVITVTLKDFEKPYFIVGGQVRHPGKFDLRGDTTVMQALDIAGGFNDSAKHSQILLYRKVSNGWAEVRKLDLRDMLRGRDLSEDPHLRPGDMLFVPKSTASKFKPFIPSAGMGIYYNPAY